MKIKILSQALILAVAVDASAQTPQFAQQEFKLEHCGTTPVTIPKGISPGIDAPSEIPKLHHFEVSDSRSASEAVRVDTKEVWYGNSGISSGYKPLPKAEQVYARKALGIAVVAVAAVAAKPITASVVGAIVAYNELRQTERESKDAAAAYDKRLRELEENIKRLENKDNTEAKNNTPKENKGNKSDQTEKEIKDPQNPPEQIDKRLFDDAGMRRHFKERSTPKEIYIQEQKIIRASTA